MKYRILHRCINALKSTLIRVKDAQELSLQLQDLLAHPNFQLHTIELATFKFYTDLIKSLVKYSRQFGAPLSKSIKELLRALAKEEQALKQIWQSFSGGIAQFLVIVAITWGFIYSLELIINHHVSFPTILKVCVLQILGGFCYLVSFLLSYKREMGGFDQAFYTVYSVRSLLQAGLPLSMVLKQSQIQMFPNSKKFQYINTRIDYLTSHGLKQGGEVLVPLTEVIGDLWELHTSSYQKFNKILMLIKFVLLVLFFVPSYLLVTFDLVSGLMSYNL